MRFSKAISPKRRAALTGYIDQGPSYALQSRIVRGLPHFKIGQKEVHLPFFIVALIRTLNLEPTFARFRVPLWFTKLDLRDFLYHGYGVRAFNIRSAIKQNPIELLREDGTGQLKSRYHRKKSIKFMTIEMDQPFYWPEPPEAMNLTSEEENKHDGGFQTALFREMNEAREKTRDTRALQVPWFDGSDDVLYEKRSGSRSSTASASGAVTKPTVFEVREAYAAEAEKLLSGRARWKPTWKSMQQHLFLTPRDGSKIKEKND